MTNKLGNIIAYIIAIMLVAIVLGLIGLEIYVWVRFANVPVNELPAWVLFFMWGVR